MAERLVAPQSRWEQTGGPEREQQGLANDSKDLPETTLMACPAILSPGRLTDVVSLHGLWVMNLNVAK